jgi:hypothetical protein
MMMVAVPSLRNHVEDEVLQVPVTSRVAKREAVLSRTASPYIFSIFEGN